MADSTTPPSEDKMVFVDPDEAEELLASDMEVADDPNENNRVPDNILDEDTMRIEEKKEQEKKLGAYRKKKSEAEEKAAKNSYHPREDSDNVETDYEAVYAYRKDADPEGVVKGKMDKLREQTNRHARELLEKDREDLIRERLVRPTTFGGRPSASKSPAENSREDRSEDELSRAASRIKRDVR